MNITRWPHLFAKQGSVQQIDWEDLFSEFAKPCAFLGDQHPGWSAAVFDPPQRKLENVRSVHAVVLDYDSGEAIDSAAETWADYYGFIHTSRKHTEEHNRFRVILPLSRPVSKFEYSALWQAIQDHAGGKLDPAPKDASRFWYTPGISDIPGATFEVRRLTGAFLDPDEWLTRTSATQSLPYEPTPINHDVALKRARKYLEAMPESVAGQHGHTALFNAVSKLLFGFNLDADTVYTLIVSEYNPRCRPPWSDRDIRYKIDNAVRTAQNRVPVPDKPKLDTRNNAPFVGGNAAPQVQLNTDQAPQSEDWHRYLRFTEKQKLTKDAHNAAIVLTHADEWQGCLEYDSFADRVYWARQPPGDIGLTPPNPGEALQDHHETFTAGWLAKHYQTSFAKQAVADAIRLCARQHEVHPLRQYIQSVRWDNIRRVPTWLQRYFGSPNDEYTSAVGRWWIISAIARAFKPGCQADHMLILEGDQGGGKSSALRILAGDWYLGTLPDIRDRERAAHALQGRWICEIGELDAIKGAAATKVKDFVSQPTDTYRKPWEREPSARPRQCVFIGTTNEEHYLQDPTGARRFWPVKTGDIDREALANERDQLIAEAYLLYISGEDWWPSDEYQTTVRAAQEGRYQVDEWETKIAMWLGDRDGFTAGEVMTGALMLDPSKWDRGAQTRVGTVLKRLGYHARQVQESGVRVRRYFSTGSIAGDVF
jgi:predicted P-loop ATPase